MSLVRQLFLQFWPTILGLILFVPVAIRHWPPTDLGSQTIGFAWGLLGLVCVAAPEEVSAYGGTVLSSHRSLTAKEAWLSRDDIAIRVFGFLVLLDAYFEVSRWLIGKLNAVGWIAV